MNKIASLFQLEEALQRDLAWRRKELSDFYVSALSCKGRTEKQSQLIRAGIVLAYAHFEGFTTLATRSYLSYVSTRNLLYSELGEGFLSLTISRMVSHETTKASYYGPAVNLLTKELATRAALPGPDAISARSNLTSARLAEMLYCIHVDASVFSLRANFLDAVLLKRRNEIAHGEFRKPTLDDYQEVHTGVIDLLDDIETLLVSAAVNARYRR